ncbi:MAG TPA: hypothetical protein ENN79_11175 [Desulfobacteraceae bacterium]|nr:hypothetical protein [Desulfobacteraceae bacterium]
MTIDIFDPTSSPERSSIEFVPRPKNLEKLRVGLVDNSKYNSKALLLRIADRLNSRYGIEIGHTVTKTSPGHPVSEIAIAALKEKVNFTVAGIGD